MQPSLLINTISSKEVKKQELNKLNYLQKLLCKIFMIVPEKRWYFTLQVKVDDIRNITVNDVVQTSDGHNWLVLSTALAGKDRFITITNPISILEYNISGPMILLYRTVGEYTKQA